MKNFTIAIFLLLSVGSVYSQLNPVWGVKAGPNIRTGFVSGADKDEDKSGILLGFLVGGTVDLSLSDQVSLQTGLTILSKGTKISYPVDNYYKLSPVYLQIPINFLFPVGEDMRIGGGPYVAFGISGKIKDETGYTEDIQFGKTNDDDWAALDVGLCLTGTKDLGAVSVGAAIEFGLTDAIPKEWNDDSYDYHIHNFNINLFAQYFFQ
jgi:hypothetical protein